MRALAYRMNRGLASFATAVTTACMVVNVMWQKDLRAVLNRFLEKAVGVRLRI